MEQGLSGTGKSALDEIHDKYGFEAKSIVTMQEVVDTLYDKEVDGRVVIDDDMKKALDAYYAQYGVKAGE